MPDKPRKQFERDCAALFGTARFPANQGGRIDFEGERIIGQCKEVKSISLAQLTTLADEMTILGDLRNKVGVVCVKHRAGAGHRTSPLVVMTAKRFAAFYRSWMIRTPLDSPGMMLKLAPLEEKEKQELRELLIRMQED